MTTYTAIVDEPYFSWLLNGPKTHEGRLRCGKWENIKAGDKLLLSSSLRGTQVEFIVISTMYANTFQDLYECLGNKLLPNNPVDAWDDCYSRFFNKSDELKYGVVGVEVKKRVY